MKFGETSVSDVTIDSEEALTATSQNIADRRAQSDGNIFETEREIVVAPSPQKVKCAKKGKDARRGLRRQMKIKGVIPSEELRFARNMSEENIFDDCSTTPPVPSIHSGTPSISSTTWPSSINDAPSNIPSMKSNPSPIPSPRTELPSGVGSTTGSNINIEPSRMPPMSSGLSQSPSQTPTMSLIPTTAPSFLQKNEDTSCEHFIGGRNISKSTFAKDVLFVYELLWLESENITEVLSVLEKSITDDIVPQLFYCSATSMEKNQHFKNNESAILDMNQTGMIGVNSHPMDIVTRDECQYIGTSAKIKCSVIRGNLTLYLEDDSYGGIAQEMVMRVVREGMHNDKYIDFSHGVVKVYHIGQSISTSTPGAAQAVSMNHHISALGISLISLCIIGAFLIIVMIIRIRRRKSYVNDVNPTSSDIDIGTLSEVYTSSLSDSLNSVEYFVRMQSGKEKRAAAAALQRNHSVPVKKVDRNTFQNMVQKQDHVKEDGPLAISATHNTKLPNRSATSHEKHHNTAQDMAQTRHHVKEAISVMTSKSQCTKPPKTIVLKSGTKPRFRVKVHCCSQNNMCPMCSIKAVAEINEPDTSNKADPLKSKQPSSAFCDCMKGGISTHPETD